MRTITVRDFAELTRNFPPMLEAAAIRGLRSAAARGVGEIVRQIDKAEPYPAVDTGAMRQSVLSEPIPDGAELSVNTPQAAWMEYGTRPHMPPFGPILTWVTRKFQLGSGSGKKARKARAGGAKGASKHGPRKPPKHGPRMSKGAKTARKAAFAAENTAKAHAIAKKIQWKIAHYGTAPRGFFKKSMVVIHTKFAPREVRHELKLLEKRL